MRIALGRQHDVNVQKRCRFFFLVIGPESPLGSDSATLRGTGVHNRMGEDHRVMKKCPGRGETRRSALGRPMKGFQHLGLIPPTGTEIRILGYSS
jgi:hypothetical protein